jgi:hypothetical protein
MSDETKTQEEKAKESFERRVAVSIGVIAAVLAYVTLCGSNSNTDTLLGQSQASDSWSYFQAKSIKAHTFELDRDLAAMMTVQDESKRTAFLDHCTKEAAKNNADKDKAMAEAKGHETDCAVAQHVNDRCGLGSLQLQVAIVLASVSILIKSRPLWAVSLLVGLSGAATAATVLVSHPLG